MPPMQKPTLVGGRFAKALIAGLMIFSLLLAHDLLASSQWISGQPISRALLHKVQPIAETDSPTPLPQPTSGTSPETQPDEAESSPKPKPFTKTKSHHGTAAATLPRVNATLYIHSIMNRKDGTLPRMMCPPINKTRYGYLKPETKQKEPTYLFALNYRDKVELLPRLMGSIVGAMRVLGPGNCAVSVVEGHSEDGADEVLRKLGPKIKALGAQYHFQRSQLDPAGEERIGRLAELRNLALAPLTNNARAFARETTVIFLNDVAACEEDILELIHQRVKLGADMVCGMDWGHAREEPTFYDVSVARTIAGDSFFDFPADGSWDLADKLFWNEEATRARYEEHKPFQVFSCWNGAAVFDARPLTEGSIRFRKSTPAECFQGEPQLFCKDMWMAGSGRIAVVPSVNLEYDDERGAAIKKARGFVTDWVGKEDDLWMIDWAGPPEQVKCLVDFTNPTWRPWDEGGRPGTWHDRT